MSSLLTQIMNESKWHQQLRVRFLHEKILISSFLFLIIFLSLDCFFQNLPISGYSLILVTLILIAVTTSVTCHGIKWAINSNKPLWGYISEQNQHRKWVKFIKKLENELFLKVFNNRSNCFDSLKYPTSLSEQVRLLIKDIERDFVKTWYSEISQNPSFLFDSHLILEEIFSKIIKKIKLVNRKVLISNVLILYLTHLQEYKKLIKKMKRLNIENEFNTKELPDLCRCFHPGSQSDDVLNYYLMKVTESILKEFGPLDFTNSLQCKILSGIISRKVVKKFLTTVEDPNWINVKMIYLLNSERYEELLQGKVYTVKEKIVISKEEEFQFKKSTLLSKRYLSSNLFENSKSLFDRNEIQSGTESKNGEVCCKRSIEKESLTLPLYEEKAEEKKGNISTVLSGLISSTAGPLLPDNISVRYQALNKMWQSPVAEVKDISDAMTNSFRKMFANGGKEKKGLTRSKSTESLTVPIESGLKVMNISIGEELCESVKFDVKVGELETANGGLTKTRSFDDEKMGKEERVNEAQSASPEMKDSNIELLKDVSPVYEEPEDFATTIAKLRSLLQQRESSSTLSDRSNLSVDSVQSTERCNSSQKLDEVESFDNPSDGLIFTNIFVLAPELPEPGKFVIQYDGIYPLRQDISSIGEPEYALRTTIVKRRVRDFVDLQTKLEENPNFKSFMKGIKGPSMWVNIPDGSKLEGSSGTFSMKSAFESFLRQLCSKHDISNSSELQEFLAYDLNGGGDTFVKKDLESSQRIDKLLANKVTGVFNSIKTVLPSFDFDSGAVIATSDSPKGFQEQKLLQNFLNFGNKPELFELNFNFITKEPTGDSLSDDIRHYFSQKSDCIEDAVDVLDSNDWLAEQRECRFISDEDKCVWQNYKDIVLEDEIEPPDSLLPIYSIILDVVTELLQDSDSWIIKEPVIQLLKVVTGHWEGKLQTQLSQLDWDRIFGNCVRLLRAAVFQQSSNDSLDLSEKETKAILTSVIFDLVPGWVSEFVKPEDLCSTVSLFVNSFQLFRMNRDVVLRLLDILLAQLLSCHHLTSDYK